MAHAILVALTPIFFVMTLGYCAGRFGMVDNHHVASLNTLVMSFALPASILVATASAPRAEILAQWPLFAVLGLVMLAVYFTWFLLRPASTAEAALQALTIAFPNLAGVGLPIASAVLGPAGAVPVAVGLAAGSLLVSPLTLVLVELHAREASPGETRQRRIFRALGRALTKPVVLAPAIGILISLLGITIDPVIRASLDLIAISAAGVALFLTGLVLSGQAFRFDWKVAGATLLGDIIRPLITILAVYLLPMPADVGRIAILLATVPSGFFGILFAVDYRLDSSTVGSMVIASTILSIATMALAITVLFPS